MQALPSYQPKASAVAPPEGNWLSAEAFAGITGVKERMGRHALAQAARGKPWKGSLLAVRTVQSTGGKSGERYEVLATSLPPELFQKWIAAKARQPIPQAPVARTIALEDCDLRLDPLLSKRTDEAIWRQSVVLPIVAFRPHTPERAAAIKSVLAQKHIRPDGTTIKVGKSALYTWLKRYERDGLTGLSPSQRKDAGASRTIITRAWDKACPLDLEDKRKIAEELRTYIRSLWANGIAGWRMAQQLASSKLMEMCSQAGWQGQQTTMLKACQISRSVIEEGRPYSLVAIYEKDAKLFFDKHLPRIRRSREGMAPMDMVVGDVHPIDIAVKRSDGSIAYPRAIAWHDVATNRLFFTLVLLRKGEGVKQTDIAKSFASMCAAWGLPQGLYLDNGSEYSWREMMDGFQKLAQLTKQINVQALKDGSDVQTVLEDSRELIRARPYNAPAKPIEGLFSVLEQGVLSVIPGWVGGDRMRKKTHNVGHEPKPFDGTWEDFQQTVDSMLTFYHQKPQEGSMKGKSPQQAYEAAIASGWGKVEVPENVLLMAFASEDTRQVRAGYLKWDGIEYYNDALLPFTGRDLTVRVAKHDPNFAFVFDGTTFICAAQPAPQYGFLDNAGAKEQARREKLLKREITGRRQNTNRLDLVGEITRHNDTQLPMPEAPIKATVSINGAVEEMVKALEAQEERQLIEFKNEKTAEAQGIQRLSQWSSHDEIDPYISAVKFTDE
ncbi:MAG: Integrase catalytic domain-containing protein [Pseudomonas helleri]|jgi:hypothetical protein|uniref:Mu transposase C-terminal domain-containing protein n=1 Tax=Pseudomonas helleri TaxID=1608996 RepID=UPI003A0FDD8B